MRYTWVSELRKSKFLVLPNYWMNSSFTSWPPHSTILYIYTATISCIIFWDFSMFYQIFLSPQVKRWANITYKHGRYELPHDLPNDLRLRNFPRGALLFMKTRVSQPIFCNWLSLVKLSWSWLVQDPFKLNFFDNFGKSKAFNTVLT